MLATDHHYPGADITPASTSEAIFAGINETVLAPDTTEGPYCESDAKLREDRLGALTADQTWRAS